MKYNEIRCHYCSCIVCGSCTRYEQNERLGLEGKFSTICVRCCNIHTRDIDKLREIYGPFLKRRNHVLENIHLIFWSTDDNTVSRAVGNMSFENYLFDMYNITLIPGKGIEYGIVKNKMIKKCNPISVSKWFERKQILSIGRRPSQCGVLGYVTKHNIKNHKMPEKFYMKNDKYQRNQSKRYHQ